MTRPRPPRRPALLLVTTSLLAAAAATALAAPVVASSDAPAALLPVGQLRTGGTGGDLAFWEDLAVVGLGDGADDTTEDDGFLLADVSDPSAVREVSRFTCHGAGYDVAVWKDLVLLAGEVPMAGSGCDARPAAPGAAGSFAGVQVISVKNKHRPVQVASVRTNRGEGAHTITLLPDLDHTRGGQAAPRLLVYTSSAAPSDVVEVPLRDPAQAKVVGAVDTRPGSLGCHDLSFFVPDDLALCAGVDESQLWDVSDPLQPQVLSHIVNPAIHHHHGAAFSWDGDTLVLAEENLENLPLDRCAGGTASPQGALWFYDISDPRSPQLRGHHQVRDASGQYCSAHQMNVVPLPDGRDVLVAGWYTAGTVVVDFTDPARPRQLASFRGDPAGDATRSNAWSSYWYDGRVYVSNFSLQLGLTRLTSGRGLDVLDVAGPVASLREAVPLRRYNFGLQEAVPGVTD